MERQIQTNEYIVIPRFKEIDMMRVVHHSAYMVWIEEARFHFMKSVLGISFDEMIAQAYYIPVIELSVRFIHSVRIHDKIIVKTRCLAHQSGKISFLYELVSQQDEKMLFFKGSTKHVFTDTDFKLQFKIPRFYYERLKKAQQTFPYYVSLEKDYEHAYATI